MDARRYALSLAVNRITYASSFQRPGSTVGRVYPDRVSGSKTLVSGVEHSIRRQIGPAEHAHA